MTVFYGNRLRVGLWLTVLVLYGFVICFGTAGSGDGWRDPIEIANAIDPNALARGWHDAAADPFAALTAVVLQIAILAPIGALAALALGRSFRSAVLAACAGFDVSLMQQIIRCLRPHHAPSLIAPALAILAALTGWTITCVAGRLPRRHRQGTGRIAVAITLFHIAAATGICAAFVAYAIATMGMTPAQIATFLTLHGAGRRPIVAQALQTSAALLERLDRMNLAAGLPPPSWAGANRRRDVPRPAGRLRTVDSVPTLIQSLNDARAGDVIELLPGHYQISATIPLYQPGTAASPIVVRAPSLGTVVIDATTVEAFKLFGPHWVFENLVMRGACPDDSNCDHAFHIVGGAEHAEFRNLELQDFNAHFKINGEGGGFPDGGLIEYVTLLDTHPRRTTVPVTPIDLDTASDWRIANSFVADFAKSGGDQISYGGYAKAAGSNNVFERNVVLCEWHLRGLPGQRIGLSLGGGGSGASIRRDLGRSGYEQSGSVIRDNLIAACSDAGIYVNRSPDSLIVHNTLLDTAGIDVRFPESMASVEANLVDGPIRVRDGGLLWQDGNLSTGLWRLFAGRHPIRQLFTDAAQLNLRWRGTPPSFTGATAEADLCHQPRLPDAPGRPGAIIDFDACVRSDLQE